MPAAQISNEEIRRVLRARPAEGWFAADGSTMDIRQSVHEFLHNAEVFIDQYDRGALTGPVAEQRAVELRGRFKGLPRAGIGDEDWQQIMSMCERLARRTGKLPGAAGF